MDKGVNDKIKVVLNTFLVTVICIIVNISGRYVSNTFSLFFWFDSLGTVLAGYILGPFGGAVVGASGNIILGLYDRISAFYALTSIFIGTASGLAARKKYFTTFFDSMRIAGIISLGAAAVSSVLNICLNNGVVGNVWGDGVRCYAEEHNIPPVISSVLGEIYIDFADKVLTVLILYLLLVIHRKIKEKRAAGFAKSAASVIIAAVTAAGIIPQKAEAYDDSTADLQHSFIQTVYNNQNGFPSGTANDIAQTNDGILWIGTYAGLYRYSGNDFELMNNYEGVYNVNCLYTDSEGRLWIGTNDCGLVLLVNEKIANIVDSADGLPSDSVRSIVQCSDGDYYIGTSGNMAIVRMDYGMFIADEIPEIKYAQQSSADDNGHVSAITADGCVYLLKNRKICTFSEHTAGGDEYQSCSFSNDGYLYLGTKRGVIEIYDVSNDRLDLVRSVKCSDHSEIEKIYFSYDGSVYICSDSGVGYLKDGKFCSVETGSYNTSVVDMEIDYQGNFWFVSNRMGILRMTESAFSDIFTETGVMPQVVNTTFRRGDKLYCGTDNGLEIIDIKAEKPVYNKLTEMFKNVRIRCITENSSGDILICSFGNGLTAVHPDGSTETYFDAGVRVRTAVEISDGSVVFTGEEGICYLKDGVITRKIPYSDDLGYAQILCICESRSGTLLAGTDGNGICEISDGRVINRICKDDGLGSGVVMRIVRCDEYDCDFAVTSNAVCRLKNNEAVPIRSFPYYNNYDIVLDDDGEAFVMGSSGIYVVKTSDLAGDTVSAYELLDHKTGLTGMLTANPFNHFDSSGNIYLSTGTGVFCFDTDNYIPGRNTYRIRISNIVLDGKSYTVPKDEDIVIDRNVSNIQIYPEIVNFSLNDPLVQYYLEGVDKTPNTESQKTMTCAVYTNIPSGKYTFYVSIIDAESGEVYEERSYDIIKEKYIYDTGYFKVYLVLVALTLVGWITWIFTTIQGRHKLEIQNQKLELAEKKAKMGNQTIIAIANTVDARDERTSKHSQRVAQYSVLIAKELGFSKEEQENLHNAALLHDIGKIGIPDSILNKPARLTDEEYAVMKTHVTRGAAILKDFTIIDHAAEGARYHHERYDGKGYPDGLKGEDIPVYGRIIAVADAFDAMTANRVYRKQLDFDFVLNEIERCKGTQFDPEMADIFLKIIREGRIDIAALYEVKETPQEDRSKHDKDNEQQKDRK